MTKVSCLKRMFTAMSGRTAESIPGNTICEVLHAMGDFFIGGGFKFVVNVTGTEGSYTADHTLAEIRAAQAAGKIVECHYSVFTLHPLMMTDGACSFSCDVSSSNTTAQRTTINITPSGVGIAVFDYVLTPVT